MNAALLSRKKMDYCTPQEFFDADAEQPKELSKLISDLKKLNKRQLENIADIVNDLANGNRR